MLIITLMDEDILYILDEDKYAASMRISELEKEIQELGPEFHDVFNQSSETWHDNAPFDALRDRQSVLFAELQSLKMVLSKAAISIPKAKKNRIGIGDTVTVEDAVSGKISTYFIAGDWTARTGRSIDNVIIISSRSPLAKALVGKTKGDSALFRSKLIIKNIEFGSL